MLQFIPYGVHGLIYDSIILAPPSFEIKKRTQTALISENTVLECEAKGEKPIGVLWNMNNRRLDANVDSRYFTDYRYYIKMFGTYLTFL